METQLPIPLYQQHLHDTFTSQHDTQRHTLMPPLSPSLPPHIGNTQSGQSGSSGCGRCLGVLGCWQGVHGCRWVVEVMSEWCVLVMCVCLFWCHCYIVHCYAGYSSPCSPPHLTPGYPPTVRHKGHMALSNPWTFFISLMQCLTRRASRVELTWSCIGLGCNLVKRGERGGRGGKRWDGRRSNINMRDFLMKEDGKEERRNR